MVDTNKIIRHRGNAKMKITFEVEVQRAIARPRYAAFVDLGQAHEGN